MANPPLSDVLRHLKIEVWLMSDDARLLSHGPVTTIGNLITTTIPIREGKLYRIRWRSERNRRQTGQCAVTLPAIPPEVDDFQVLVHSMVATDERTQSIVAKPLWGIRTMALI
ncbi:hypothetical protein DFH09DRAFT_1301433 [Mycena vulgaris]|nr:hypothetical protein DFH09DRAFT_1301433 [Mycena vulgaris]